MNTTLLCHFTDKNSLKKSINNIIETYYLPRKQIFILENVIDKNELYCTFNVSGKYTLDKKSIIIHRNSETKTLFTINAMNSIIARMNNGVVSEEVEVPWENYSNSILFLNPVKDLIIVEYDLKEIIKL